MAEMPLMPKATAVWLIDNTTLTFEQIARFCQLHLLEVQGIADGDVASGIKGMSPIDSGQLSREMIRQAEQDPNKHLSVVQTKVVVPKTKRRGPRYTPLSKRHDRPNAILWLVRNHEDLKDAQIIRLVGTTKNTIQAIRDRSHWNISNLQPLDPVTLGLCTQMELDGEIRKAANSAARKAGEKIVPPSQPVSSRLLPAQETTGGPGAVDETGGIAAAQGATTAADVPEPTAMEQAEALFDTAGPPSAGPDAQADPVDTGTDDIDADAVFAKLADPESDGENNDETANDDTSKAGA